MCSCVFRAILLMVAVLSSGGLAPAQKARLGINISGPSDWNTELPLVDVFHLSRTWISQREGAPWGGGPKLRLDRHGWVRSLEPGCWAETPLCTIEGGHYPSGRYTVFYKGRGHLEFAGAARVAKRAPGRITLDVDSSRGPIWLRLRRTDKKNPLRDIHVIMPGFEKTWGSNPWHPDFLRRWRGFAALRFMDLMQTNNSRATDWSTRAGLRDATWTEKGLPIEILCDLANRLEIDPWFCIPHQADDDFVRRFAGLVKEKLAPNLKVYIEYSNEVWNSIFEQHRWAAKKGQALKLADQPWEAAWKYYSTRSVAIFKLWEKEFGGSRRLVRVLATQAANPHVSEQILKTSGAYRHADALAVAPYFAMLVHEEEASRIADMGVAGILRHIETRALPEAIRFMKEQKAMAKRFGLTLLAYEAGQHLVGVQGGENNDRLTKLFQQVNRHPAMGKFYTRYYNAWKKTGGDLMCVFASVNQWSKWGCWGLLEHADEDPRRSPKFMATLRWARKHGQKVLVPR